MLVLNKALVEYHFEMSPGLNPRPRPSVHRNSAIPVQTVYPAIQHLPAFFLGAVSTW
jgi:hypothetical protein